MEPYDRPSSNASGAAAVRQVEQQCATSPEEQTPGQDRAARVEELRVQYLQGTYRVDSAELSAEIIDKHLKK